MARRPTRRGPTPFLLFSAAVHAGCLGALVAAPSRWPLLLAALLLDQATVVGASLWPRGRLLGPNLVRLPPNLGADAVALTFDDGPDPSVTPEVLELLERHGATATFFCVGERAEAHPDLTAEIVRRGHRVENHSFSHSKLFYFSPPGALGRELDLAQRTLEALTGRRPVYFRAPAGFRSPWLDLVLARCGLHLVSWTRRGFDTFSRDPDRVTARLLRGLAAGDLLLLHDGSAATAASGRPVVLQVLPSLLEAIAARGLRTVSLPEPAPPLA